MRITYHKKKVRYELIISQGTENDNELPVREASPGSSGFLSPVGYHEQPPHLAWPVSPNSVNIFSQEYGEMETDPSFLSFQQSLSYCPHEINEEGFSEPIITSLMTEIAMRPSTGYEEYFFSDISTAD